MTYYQQAYQKWKNDNPGGDLKLPGLGNFTQDQLFFIGNAQVSNCEVTIYKRTSRISSDQHFDVVCVTIEKTLFSKSVNLILLFPLKCLMLNCFRTRVINRSKAIFLFIGKKIGMNMKAIKMVAHFQHCYEVW